MKEPTQDEIRKIAIPIITNKVDKQDVEDVFNKVLADVHKAYFKYRENFKPNIISTISFRESLNWMTKTKKFKAEITNAELENLISDNIHLYDDMLTLENHIKNTRKIVGSATDAFLLLEEALDDFQDFIDEQRNNNV